MRWIIGRLIRLAVLASVVSGVVLFGLALYTQYAFQESFRVTWSRFLAPQVAWQRDQRPSLRPALAIAGVFLSGPDPRDEFGPVGEDPPIVRPNNWRSTMVGPRVAESPDSIVATGTGERVSTIRDLTAAIDHAVPGAVITLAPGTYDFSGHSIEIRRSGTADLPVILRADSLGAVTLRFDLLEGLHVQGAYWIIENFVIEGTCRTDNRCEHAFHVAGAAVGTQIRNNWVSNFNSPVKVNGSPRGFPDNGTISRNAFVNDRPRATDNPVTFLDIVAANGWRVEGNFIADFAKAKGNRVSYGAFFKGAGANNIFERNLVRCEWRHHGGTRIGFSFGGGGTTADACRDRKCAQEHSNGIMRSNIVMDCPNDVGVYLNKSTETLIHNNLILNTRGIDVRFATTTATLFNNVIDGRVFPRDGGSYTASKDVTSMIDAILDRNVSAGVFKSPATGDLRLTDPDAILDAGLPVPASIRDFCGQPYLGGTRVIGPFQYGPNIGCAPLVP